MNFWEWYYDWGLVFWCIAGGFAAGAMTMVMTYLVLRKKGLIQWKEQPK